MPYDILTIGSATIDQFADTDSELIQIQTPTTLEKLIAFPLGSKILIRELNLDVGGGGTNSAVAFARLGLHTACLGKIGADVNGDHIVRALANEHIDFIGPRAGVSGISVILNSFTHDRTILAYKGSNNDLQVDEVGPLDAPWIYLASVLGDSFRTVVTLLSRGTHRIAFNPSNYQAEMGAVALMPLLAHVEILVMNYEEACKFLGHRYETRPDIRTLFEGMAKLPPKLFVITDGDAGTHAFDRAHYYRAFPADNLQVVETTGAGDAFASTFTAAQIWGEPMEQAIHLGMTNAESVLGNRGAKTGLLSRDALFARARSHSRRIEKSSWPDSASSDEA
jgi:ribokinase